MTKTFFSAILLFLCVSLSYTQPLDENQDWQSELDKPDPNFYEVVRKAENYYQAFPDPDGYKDFMRWRYYWESRVSDNGDNPGSFKPMHDLVQQLLDEEISACENGAGNWQGLGPFTVPERCDNGNCNGISGMGKVLCIEVDSSDPDSTTIYAGTNGAGLWMTSNADASTPIWTSLTEKFRLPGIGVYDIQIDPSPAPPYEKLIYIGGGLESIWTGSKNAYSMGILKLKKHPTNGWELDHETSLSYATQIGSINRILVNPQQANIVYAVAKVNTGTKPYKIYKTTDKFEDSNNLSIVLESDYPFMDIQFQPGNPNTIYVSEGGKKIRKAKFYTSNDAGSTWNTQDAFALTGNSNQQFDFIRIGTSTNPLFDHMIYLLGYLQEGSVSQKTIIRSTDAGTTWQTIPASGLDIDESKHEIIISPTDPNTIYIGGVKHHKSTNGGQNIPLMTTTDANSNKYVHADCRDLKTDILTQNGQEIDVIYSANDGGVSRSKDGGTTWEDLSGEGLNIAQFYGFAVASDYSAIVGGALDLGWNNYFPKNNTWFNRHSLGDGFDCAIDLTNSIYFGINNSTIYYSDNQGDFWNYFTGPANGNLSGASRSLEMHPNSYLYFNGFQMHRRLIDPTNPDVHPWQQIGSIFIHDDTGGLIPSNEQLRSFAVAPSNDQVIYAAFKRRVINGLLQDKLFVYDGNNNSWEDLTPYFYTDLQNGVYSGGILEGGIADIAIDPDDPKRIWVVFDRIKEGHRVYFSDNGGKPYPDGSPSWKNISKGLPKFPINTIAYQEGTDDVLYIGSDLGVWYNTNANDENSYWQCFNNGFPIATVTDLIINPCKGKILASSFGRGIWESDLAEVTRSPAVLDEEIVWDTPRELKTDLKLLAEAKLTISNTLNIAKDCRIILEAGAELVVDGGTLTNFCGELWDGIEVRGNSDAFQQVITNQQAKLITKNNAIIEHAKIAVRLYNEELADQAFPETGGFILASDTKFLNNIIGVEFREFTNQILPHTHISFANVSDFSFCDFKIDDDFRADVFRTHVRMKQVSGIDFKSCNFLNTHPRLTGLDRGRAIHSLDASFKVFPASDAEIDRPVFDGFNIGIDAGLNFSLSPYSVDRTDFIRNRVGIYNPHTDLVSITRSNFVIGGFGAELSPTNYIHEGIVLYLCTGFRVEDNTFTGAGATVNSNTPTTIGIRAHYTGSANNQIRKNTFNQLFVANLANGYNGSNVNAAWGLRYLCNENQGSNTFDFNVNQEGSIAQNQGGIEEASGNKLSLNQNNPASDFFNASNSVDVQYFYFNTPSNANKEKPENYFGLQLFGFNVSENPCESIPYPDGNTGGVISTGNPIRPKRFYRIKHSLDSIRIVYEEKIDGGSTNALVTQINTSTPDDLTSLKSELLSLSPFLSETSLKTTVDRTDLFSDAELYDILVANPNISKTKVMLDYLAHKPTPLANSYLNSLQQISFNINERTSIESRLSDLALERDQLAFDILRYYSLDTNVVVKDSISQWLTQEGSLNSYYRIIEQSLSNNLSQVNQQLNNLTQYLDLDTKEQLSYQRYQSLQAIRNNLLSTNKAFHTLDLVQQENLQNLAQDSTDRVGAITQNILNYDFGESYFMEPILPILPAQEKWIPDDKIQATVESQNFQITALPNPASRKVQFQYRINSNDDNYFLHLSNASGSIIKKWKLTTKEGHIFYDITELSNGIYYYSIFKANKLLLTRQLVISR